MERLIGCQPGLEGMSGYLAHWYDNEGSIACPARDCSMQFHNGLNEISDPDS